ncbi:MAG TPA: hypothetical protein VHW95_02715, partial [Steroidobacteraceae bacterium]|nr:hypothetical protein [Steroidobacteraceae bacterium]
MYVSALCGTHIGARMTVGEIRMNCEVCPGFRFTPSGLLAIHSANLSSDKREPNMTDTPQYTP